MKAHLLPALVLAGSAAAQVLDHPALLKRQTFWENRDFEWFEANIPFFECPDEEVNTTYYYRWELVTKHLVYGSPDSGYSFTEFIDRPFWSGAYGSISCPSGHQIAEIRWLNDPRYVRDYLKYWFHTPGAQPRNYSSWLADSAWAVQQVYPNKSFTTGLLPDLVKNHDGWVARQWVPDMGMFWQSGHDDGMEFNINSRQTRDILRGEQSFRPSFNTYMWADEVAIAKVAELAGDAKTAETFRDKAAALRKRIQQQLWDPKRGFFFPMSARDETDKEGVTVRKHTLTYQSGRFEGSEHGRELHGYVPWAFNLPEKGFEAAWKFLMDSDYFQATYGPSTVERHDPMFLLKDSCCWWSGQSWPFATTQTLKAMANLLQNYQQDFVSRGDYAKLLHTFAVSHRKDGKPYIAEALHPDTGLWDGHDAPNHSEHYFHSGFNDLVITGLVGLKTADDDTLTIDPLAPAAWDYFALDHLSYRGHQLAIVWDRNGTRYQLGAGFHLLVDGKRLAKSPTLGKLTATLPAAREIRAPDEIRVNHAVNNDGNPFPRFTASFVARGTSLAKLCDGERRYDIKPANRWTAAGSPDGSDWVEVDFGTARVIDEVKLHVLDDGKDILPPAGIELQAWNGNMSKAIPGQKVSAGVSGGDRPYTLKFPPMKMQRLRAVIRHAPGARSGLTEFEAWGTGKLPYEPAPRAPGNLAAHRTGDAFPKAAASHTDRFGGDPAAALDGKIIFLPTPMNRWTSYESGNPDDWFQLDFEKPETVGRVVLYLFDDRGGVQAPEKFSVEAWQDGRWLEIPNATKSPAVPTGGMANEVAFPPRRMQKLRIVFTHKPGSGSGMTEFEAFAK